MPEPGQEQQDGRPKQTFPEPTPEELEMCRWAHTAKHAGSSGAVCEGRKRP